MEETSIQEYENKLKQMMQEMRFQLSQLKKVKEQYRITIKNLRQSQNDVLEIMKQNINSNPL